MPRPPRVIVLFGPTASGKTAAAVRLARAVGGEVINADSRQLYRQMPVITACPGPEERAACPHHLFEVLDPTQRCSAAMWAGMAQEAIAQVLARGRVPLLVGGTGFYLRALMEGVSAIPDVPPAVEASFRGADPRALHAQLRDVDPPLAARLQPTDTQRLVRALAVARHTGVALSEWQQGARAGAPYAFARLALSPDRAVLHARIARRWQAMLDAGVVDEVRALRAAGYDPALPAMTGLGIPELGAYLDGALTLEEAGRRVVAGSRRYAKRQVTWLRHSYHPDRVFADGEDVAA